MMMEKERRNPRSRANLKREEEVANKLMNTVMFVGRELEAMEVDASLHQPTHACAHVHAPNPSTGRVGVSP
jgi:hypothetical protein